MGRRVCVLSVVMLETLFAADKYLRVVEIAKWTGSDEMSDCEFMWSQHIRKHNSEVGSS